MNLRFWNAIGWGVVGFTVTVCGLWSFTMMEIFEVLFCAIMVYLAVISVILWITEPKKKTAPKWNPKDCPIQTLKRGEWK